MKKDALTEEDAAVVGELWPDGPHPDDVTLLRSLPCARRSKAMARLRALARIERMRRDNPRAHVDLRGVASEAGLTPDGLVAIRRKWANERRVAAVVPYLGRAERQPTQRTDDDPVVMAARALIVERPGDADSVVAGELRRRTGLSAPVLVRLIRRLRRDDATDPTRVREVFGTALLIDLCAIDRVAVGSEARAILCAIVVERASGLVVGHALAEAGDDTLATQAVAVRRAISWLGEMRLDRVDGVAEVELTLGDGPRLHVAAALAETLKVEGVDLRVNSLGPRRYGQRLVSLLGKRLGRMWWRPRSSSPDAAPAAVDLGAVMSISDAELFVAAEVDSHDGEVLERLAEGGIRPGWGETQGAMVRALRRMLSLLDGGALERG